MGRTTIRRTGIAFFAGAALLFSTGSPAQEIYRWVDADGVTHFSDQPPQTHISEFETVVVDVSPPTADEARADLFNIEATAERMRAIREELDEDLDARRDRQRNSATPPVVQYPESSGYGVAWPYGYPAYPRPPRPQPPRPEPPPADDTATWRPPGRSDG